MKKTYIGGITKTYDNPTRYGFKIEFESQIDANKYKDMISYIIKTDKYKVTKNYAAYDLEEYK